MPKSKKCRTYTFKKVVGSTLKGRVGKHLATMKLKDYKFPVMKISDKIKGYNTLRKAGVPVAEIKFKHYPLPTNPIKKVWISFLKKIKKYNPKPDAYSSEKLILLKKRDLAKPKIIKQFARMIKNASKHEIMFDTNRENFGIDGSGNLKLCDYTHFPKTKHINSALESNIHAFSRNKFFGSHFILKLKEELGIKDTSG